MKMKVGNKLFSARENKNLTQTEMADLLGVSSSVYSRLERNETSVALEQLETFSEILDVPIQDFLPETMSINHSNNKNGQVGFIIGNFYSYGNEDILSKQNKELIEKIKLLESRINDLEEINSLLKKQINGNTNGKQNT